MASLAVLLALRGFLVDFVPAVCYLPPVSLFESTLAGLSLLLSACVLSAICFS